MRKWFQNHSLKFKVVTVMAGIIVVYSIIFSTYILSDARKKTRAQVENTHAETLRQFTNYVDNLQRYVFNLFTTVYADDAVMRLLGAPAAQNAGGKDSSVHSFLLRTLFINGDLTFGALVNDRALQTGQYVAINNSYGLRSYRELQSAAIIRAFEQSENGMDCYLLPADDTSVLTRNQNDQILFLHHVKNPSDDFNKIAYFMLGVDVRALEKNIASVVDTATGGVLVLGAQGEFLYQSGSLLPQETCVQTSGDQKYIVNGGKQYLVSMAQSNMMGWQVYYYQRVQENYLLTPLVVIAFVCAGAAVVFIFMAWLATSAITAPINKLLASIEKFQQGDFDQHVDITYPDEIGRVTEGYNLIVTRIRELIRQNYEIKIHEQQAQLAALETQINPHFLYNTLDLLFWKAVAYKQTEISEMIHALSKLFRISLNKGNSFITYEKELEFLSAYLQLQTSLLSDTLTFSIDCDPSLWNTYLPRFVLQPFVENAIVHGFGDGQEQPHISIRIERHEEYAVVTIGDNGTGMTDEQIAAIAKRKEGSGTGGYAIYNVLSRLKLYFGYRMRFEIHSAPQQGTQISLSLPVTEFPYEGGAFHD